MLCLGLVGCSGAPTNQLAQVTDGYEIGAVERPRRITITDLDQDGRLTPHAHRRVALILDAFRERARGPLVAAVSGLPSSQRQRLAQDLADLALRRGVDPARLELVELPDALPALRLVYRDYEATVPTCGFERQTLWDFDNRLTQRSGCALNRSIGAMIARPADLISPPTPSSRDSERVATVMSQYEQGKPTGAEAERLTDQAVTTE